MTKGRIAAAHGQYSLYFATGRPFPLQGLKIAFSHGNLDPIEYVPRPTQVYSPKGISIGSAVFAGLTIVTDRQTDHATWVTTGRTTVVLRCGLIIITYVFLFSREVIVS